MGTPMIVLRVLMNGYYLTYFEVYPFYILIFPKNSTCGLTLATNSYKLLVSSKKLNVLEKSLNDYDVQFTKPNAPCCC